MRNSILVITIIWTLGATGQLQLESNFNSVHIGRNQSITVGYNWSRFSIYGGLKYNINKLDNFPESQMFKKTSWATTTGEHIGFNLGAKFEFLQLKNISFFVHYDLQQSFTHFRHISINYLGSIVPEPTSEYDLVYHKTLAFIGPIWIFENNLGIGYKVHIYKGLFLTNKFGGGIMFFKNTDPLNWIITGGGNWELSEMISFGIGWIFDKQ